MSPDKKTLVLGGQAVIEGVMMKGARMYAVAVRKANGEIRVKDFPIVEKPLRRRLLRMPLVRGVVTMAAMLVIGYRALQFSADEAMADGAGERSGPDEAPGQGGSLAMAGALVLAILIAVGLFFLLPLVLTRGAEELFPAISGRLAFNLVDGALRVGMFVAYVLGISTMKDIRRVFQYHGAEHKVINAYERRAPLSPESVQGFARLHPRCGTSFLLFVMVISVFVFSFIPHDSSLAVKALMRGVLLPAVAGISYEVLRLSARKADTALFRALVWPGMLLQRLTTREPDLSQIEVAIASFGRIVPVPAGGAGGVHVG